MRAFVLNIILAYCLLGIPYSAISGVVDWKKLDPRLPDQIVPFDTWPMFKFMLRSESVIRLEGRLTTGELVNIPTEEVFTYKSLEGRTVLDHSTTVALLRIDYIARVRRNALATVIVKSAIVQQGQFERIHVLIDTSNVYTGEAFATIELMQLELATTPGTPVPLK